MLVILGLLVGGVVGGRELIHTAEIQATIGQVNTLKIAAATFKEKYFYLPGDIPTADATRLGLGLYPYYGTAGDGNGVVAGGANGEPNLFFMHLSQKGLIPGSYQAFDLNGDVSGTQVGNYIMKAKLAGSFYLNAWSGGPNPAGATNCYDNGNVAGTPQKYSTSLNNGMNQTCALSFRM